ncbi:MAG: sugar phosphate nucleotidyltransferase [Candidatus Omnitrophota bacterium]|nr:sugar phosphate nucleotidyltransferase [Candidatus Omnitrophota bacterium]
MIEDTDVLILCGGEGKRLKKISGKTPKPMVRMGRRVFLDIIIENLRRLGFKRIILGIGYQAKFIRKYYTEHKVPGLEIIFSEEKKPLGTGGAVKKAKRLIKSESFFVLNGDTFLRFNADKFIKFYSQKKSQLLILLKKAKANKDYGAITMDRNSKIISFNEKDCPRSNNFVNGGVYLFNKNVFSQMPKSHKFSLEYDFFPQMIGKGLYGYNEAGTFIDIGTPERYFTAKKYLLKN